MEQSKAIEYESRKASSDVLKPCNIYIYIYIRTFQVIIIIITIIKFMYFFNVEHRV